MVFWVGLFTSHLVESTSRLEPRDLSFVHCVQQGDLFFVSISSGNLTLDWLERKSGQNDMKEENLKEFKNKHT